MNFNRPQDAGGAPIDEGWWAAVLQEEESHFSAKRGNGRPSSPAQGDPAADWQAARSLYEADEPVELDAVGYNRGGLLVSFRSLQGFVPASHLVNFPNQVSEEERMSALSHKVGAHLKLRSSNTTRPRGGSYSRNGPRRPGRAPVSRYWAHCGPAA